MTPSEEAEYRQSLLLSPGERQEVDYKAALPFDPGSEFTLKLFRHIQGMANSGGGVLVIGYVERQGFLPAPDPNMSERIAATYEPTDLLKRANKTVMRGQSIELSVFQEKHPQTGNVYTQLHIRGVRGTPLVCRSRQPDIGVAILRPGAVYIRRPGAETSEASTPSDFEGIIRRAQQADRDDLLSRIRELIGGPVVAPPRSPSPSDLLQSRISEGRKRAFGRSQ